MTNLTGQSIGRYYILEQLGEGGMATVYKAFDTRLERDVAIKVIRRTAFHPEQLERILKRFEREAKALARLSDPNILKVLDYGEHEGEPYLVMSYLPGGTLKQQLGGKQIPWQDAVRLLLPVARALHYAHQQGIVHRDVKPANILITQSGEPMLTDFGIAKILMDTEDTFDLTGTGMGIGTPEYMSPEQFQGTNVDARTDVYALGVVLYEMVTGRKPYQADTPAAVLIKQATDPLPSPARFVPGLPDVVEKLILKALAKQPENRYPNMESLASAMQSLLQTAPVQNKTSPAPESASSWNDLDRLTQYDAPIRDETPAALYTPLPASQTPPPRRAPAWLWGAGGLVLIALLILAVVNLLQIGMTSPVPISTETETPRLTATLTPTETETPPLFPTPAQDCQYVVRRGDTVNQIALRFGINSSQIYRVDGTQRNMDSINAGEMLILNGVSAENCLIQEQTPTLSPRLPTTIESPP
jgi:eukaryotic-like serine/threonine-protein kinase